MKKLIMTTVITACIALCAAVWPHDNATEEHPSQYAETAVSARKRPLRKLRNPQHWQRRKKERFRESAPEEQPEPEIGPIETPVASELQPSMGSI